MSHRRPARARIIREPSSALSHQTSLLARSWGLLLSLSTSQTPNAEVFRAVWGLQTSRPAAIPPTAFFSSLRACRVFFQLNQVAVFQLLLLPGRRHCNLSGRTTLGSELVFSARADLLTLEVQGNLACCRGSQRWRELSVDQPITLLYWSKRSSQGEKHPSIANSARVGHALKHSIHHQPGGKIASTELRLDILSWQRAAVFLLKLLLIVVAW